MDRQPEEHDEDAQAGGGLRLARARRHLAESYVRPTVFAGELQPLVEVGHEVEEFVQEQLHQNLARGTQLTYQAGWDRWCWWAVRQGCDTPYLTGETKRERIADEDQLLTFSGYLAWCGLAPGTIRQALFAIQGVHKRAGAWRERRGSGCSWRPCSAAGRRRHGSWGSRRRCSCGSPTP